MSKPVVLVFAGPNGSGKSTITRLMPNNGAYINADDLKKEYALTDLEAAQKAEVLRNKLIEKKVAFTFETVLSTERNLHLLRNAKENGYPLPRQLAPQAGDRCGVAGGLRGKNQNTKN